MQDNIEIETPDAWKEGEPKLSSEKLSPFERRHDAVVVWFPSQDRTPLSRFGQVKIWSIAPLPLPIRPIGNIHTLCFSSLLD